MKPEDIQELVEEFCKAHGLAIIAYESIVFKHEETGNFFYGEDVGRDTKRVGYWTEETGYYYPQKKV